MYVKVGTVNTFIHTFAKTNNSFLELVKHVSIFLLELIQIWLMVFFPLHLPPPYLACKNVELADIAYQENKEAT